MDAILQVNDFEDVPDQYRDHEHTVEHADDEDEKFVVVRAVAGAAELKSGEGVRIFTDAFLDADEATDIEADDLSLTAGVVDASHLGHIDLD